MTTEATPREVGSHDGLGLVGRLRAPSMTGTTATHIDRMRMAADEIERLLAERDTLSLMRHTLIRLVHEVREANAAASDGQTFRLLTRRQELAWQALVDACCRAGGQEASAATTPPPDHADVDILAAYSRNDGRREWVSVGTWLRPGEVVAHMDDPRPQQASGATTGYASGTAT